MMIESLSVLELVGIITVCAGFAGTMAYMVLTAIKDYYLDSDIEDYYSDDDFEELEPDISPILLSGESFKDGDKVYDIRTSLIVTYGGSDEYGAICVYYKSEYNVRIYRTDIDNLIKVA